MKLSGKKWFIEYWFRVPEQFQHKWGEWRRYKVYEDINRIKTKEYAHQLYNAVKQKLEEGHNPFKEAQARLNNRIPKAKSWTIQQAILFFKQKWSERGLEQNSIRKYDGVADRLLDWFRAHKLEHEDLKSITLDHIELYLSDKKKLNKWSNRSFNNERDFVSTIFNFFERKKMIDEHPVRGIMQQPTVSKKHKYYDQDKFDKIREVMKEHDPLVHFASSLVYYLCVRSEKELSLLQLQNIFLDRKQVLIRGEDAKTDSDRMIPIPDELLPELIELKKRYKDATYVIGVTSKNKFVRDNTPGQEPFGRGFLSKRFAKIRKLAKLSSDYTLMGFRHTRCVHLKLDGASDSDIMLQMGHTDFATTAKYLRDLGVAVDQGRISKLSRKF